MIKGSKKLNCIVCPSICSGQGVIYIVPEFYTNKYNIKFMCDECNTSFESTEDLANNIDSKFSFDLLNNKRKKSFYT